MQYANLASKSVQAVLSGLDVAEVTGNTTRTEALPTSRAATAPHLGAPPAAARRGPRHRYWSIRDLSRRLWLGRGYELLRELIRTGILPATRSTRTWWVVDADVRGLLAAFDAGAGKVRAFRGLDQWLRERCWVLPLTPEIQSSVWNTRTGFNWRGAAYLPKRTWKAEIADDGHIVYRHSTGLSVPSTVSIAK
ncbi:MAG: hypothetical protein HY332_25675 [Chloroflexi bacterium]|nr:hypothetical protein [Chloroflexota bacterium]